MIEPQVVEVDFDPNAFNPLFWHLKKYLEDPAIRYIFIYGGSSAAKTFEIAHLFEIKTIQEEINCKVFRKELATAWDSVYNDFKIIAKQINEDFESEVFSIKNHWIDVNETNQIKFGGMDDPEKAKGLSDFKYILMNELSKFSFDDLKEIRRRMRGIPGQTLVGDWNPIDEDHWLKTELIDKIKWSRLPNDVKDRPNSRLDSNSSVLINEKGNTVLILTTYKDNFWIVGHPVKGWGMLDRETIDEFDWMKENAPLDYEVYGLGMWGRKKTGDEAYKDFDFKENTSPDLEFDVYKPLHIAFDFNVHPYVTLLVYQTNSYDSGGNDIFQIDEICSEPPLNRTVDAVKEFIKRYGKTQQKIYVYGDPTGANEDTRGANDYTLIANELKSADLEVISKVLNSAPPVQARIKFVNAIFGGRAESKLTVGRHCRNTIKDFTRVYENADGTKVKRRVKDKTTKIIHEELGHTSDATEYFICSLLSEEFSKFKAAVGGKPIITSPADDSFEW